MRTPFLAGRDFDSRDTPSSARVAIVTESFARVFYGGQNPVGRIFQIDEAPGDPRPMFEIVGLARDSKYGDVRESFEPLMFMPAAQDDQPAGTLRLLVRAKPPIANATAAVTALARDVHPSIIATFRTLESQVRDTLLRERLMAALSGLFGALAAIIAMIGADRGDVVRMVMAETGALLAAGLGVGTLLALAAARAAAALLYGLKPYDPATLLMAIAALSAVAALAGYVPARRASRLEPTVALRQE
jgi:putative ABC transport system permease protein